MGKFEQGLLSLNSVTEERVDKFELPTKPELDPRSPCKVSSLSDPVLVLLFPGTIGAEVLRAPDTESPTLEVSQPETRGQTSSLSLPENRAAVLCSRSYWLIVVLVMLFVTAEM